jgi:hypothetical protein
MAGVLKIPWWQFFKRLCDGLFSNLDELQSIHSVGHSIRQELNQLSQAMPQRDFRVPMFSALFWHEWPLEQGLADMESWLRRASHSDSVAIEDEDRQEIATAAQTGSGTRM